MTIKNLIKPYSITLGSVLVDGVAGITQISFISTLENKAVGGLYTLIITIIGLLNVVRNSFGVVSTKNITNRYIENKNKINIAQEQKNLSYVVTSIIFISIVIYGTIFYPKFISSNNLIVLSFAYIFSILQIITFSTTTLFTSILNSNGILAWDKKVRIINGIGTIFGSYIFIYWLQSVFLMSLFLLILQLFTLQYVKNFVNKRFSQILDYNKSKQSKIKYNKNLRELVKLCFLSALGFIVNYVGIFFVEHKIGLYFVTNYLGIIKVGILINTLATLLPNLLFPLLIYNFTKNKKSFYKYFILCIIYSLTICVVLSTFLILLVNNYETSIFNLNLSENMRLFKYIIIFYSLLSIQHIFAHVAFGLFGETFVKTSVFTTLITIVMINFLINYDGVFGVVKGMIYGCLPGIVFIIIKSCNEIYKKHH